MIRKSIRHLSNYSFGRIIHSSHWKYTTLIYQLLKPCFKMLGSLGEGDIPHVSINDRERNLLLATLGDYQSNPTRLSGERLAATYKHLSFSADFKGLLIMTECLCLGRTQGGNLW